MISRWAILALVLFVPVCAPSRMNTPSGGPELLFHSAEPDDVRGALVGVFATQGYTVAQESQSSIVFSRLWDDTSGIVYKSLVGGSYSSMPQHEIRVTLAKLPDGLRVYANVSVAMQNAFGHQDRQDVTAGDNGAWLQSVLLNVRTQLEGEGAAVQP